MPPKLVPSAHSDKLELSWEDGVPKHRNQTKPAVVAQKEEEEEALGEGGGVEEVLRRPLSSKL